MLFIRELVFEMLNEKLKCSFDIIWTRSCLPINDVIRENGHDPGNSFSFILAYFTKLIALIWPLKPRKESLLIGLIIVREVLPF